MSADSEHYPAPNNSDDFESLCLDLWKEIWQDPGARKNGRSGQAQAGVDVFGEYQGRQMGVQCKQKSGLLHTRVTIKELDDEVEKALKFKPPLHTFILATSGPADEKVQERARILSQAQDPPFKVEVWSWEKIWHELYGRKELLQRLLPIYWPRTGRRDTPQRIAPSRLTHTAEKLFGRHSELALLDAAWHDPNIHLVSIIAWGGVGKTCLVATWAAELAVRGYDGADCFDWSFYSQGTREMGNASADVFVNAALTFFGDAELAQSAASPWDKGSRLAELVAQRRALLILDGLEPLQHPPGPLEGELKDPAMKALLKGLAVRNAGLCLVTSRVKVVDLHLHQGTTAPEWDLEHLSTTAGVELLQSLGVHGARAEIERLVEDVEGHALTLNLLGRFLFRAHQGDVRRRDRVKFQKADRAVQGGHAFRAMEAYETWLGDGGEEGKRQVAVLRLLGLFDRPAASGCLAALRREPAISGLTEELVGLEEEDWSLALSALQEASLVVCGEEGSVDAHPLIREYFAHRLREGNLEGWRAAHGRLFDFLQESTEDQPEGLERLQPLYQAVVHGCLGGREQEACDKVYFDRISRGREAYVVKKLGAFGADLGAVACFFEQPWSRISSSLAEADQAWLLNQAAFRLRALGRLEEAVEPMRAGLQMRIDQEVWESASRIAGNLSALQLTLGDVQGAVRDAEQSVGFADRSGDAFSKTVSRTTLADALHHAGERVDALKDFREAEVMQAESQPSYPLLYSLRGFQYCDLLLAEPERDAWRVVGGVVPREKSRQDAGAPSGCQEVERRGKKMFDWRVPSDSILDIALDHLTLGRTLFYRAILERTDLSDAASEIELAVDGLRSAGQVDYLVRGLLTRAWLRTQMDDQDDARADLEEAWEIAVGGSMRLLQADVLMYRARLFGDREALVQARALIEKHGYGRRLEELEDAESWLGMETDGTSEG